LNGLRRAFGSDPGDYRDAIPREEWTYPGGARPKGSDTLHVTADGTVHTEPQWSGLLYDERVSQPVRRADINLAYMAGDRSVLYPEDVRDPDTSGLSMIDLNRVLVGLAAPDGRIFPPGRTGALPPQQFGLRPVCLKRHAKYEASDGRIFGAAEVSLSHPHIRGGVREIGREDAIVSGYVREEDGKVFTPQQFRAKGGPGMREVNLDHFAYVYVAKDGQVYDADVALRMHPRYRDVMYRFEANRVTVGYVSPNGLLFREPNPDATKVDLKTVDVGYVSPEGKIYRSNELPQNRREGMTPVDLNRYPPNPPQSGIAAGAQMATFRPWPPPQQYHQPLAGPSSRQLAATPARFTQPPALGR